MAEDSKERPFALCHCGTPLVGTFEMPKKEWYCVTCKEFFEWLHARSGTDPNPTPELQEQYEKAKAQYEFERAERKKVL